MNLIEDARTLHDGGYVRCFCSENGHEPRCPVSCMPQIIAALEAAEDVVMKREGALDRSGLLSPVAQLGKLDPTLRAIADLGHALRRPTSASTTAS